MDCDYKCLTGFVRGYMDALAKRDPSRIAIASNARFTENNVELSLGREGLWATVTGVAADALVAADVTTGMGAWIGTVEENGEPAYYGMRLRVQEEAAIMKKIIQTRGIKLQ